MDRLSPRKKNKLKLEILATVKHIIEQHIQGDRCKNCYSKDVSCTSFICYTPPCWEAPTGRASQITEALHKRGRCSQRQWNAGSRSDHKDLSYRSSFQTHAWTIIQSLINLKAFRTVISHETYGTGSQHKVLKLLYLIPLICFQPVVEIMPLNLHWKWVQRTNCIRLGYNHPHGWCSPQEILLSP